MKRLDLLNKVFGHLKVIYDCGSNVQGSSMWLCKCDCGKTTLVRGWHLKEGHITGCGCRQKLPKGESQFNGLFESYKRQAGQRKLDFKLNKKQFKKLTSSNCFYCGSIPQSVQHNQRANGDYVYNGIDRLDNSKGYFVKNCVSCCGLCNWMKRELSKDAFLQHIRKIYSISVSTVK